MTEPRILVTGFEPFGNHATNPSGEVARALAGPSVQAAILPVEHAAIYPALEKLLARPWDAVLLLGLAEGRPHLSLEFVAINYRSRSPDNAGRLPDHPEVVRDGPAAYFSTLPVGELRDGIRAAGLPAEVSLTAGAYVCNAVFYLARHRLDGAGTPCGFLHVPPTPPIDAPVTPMELEDQIRGVGVVVDALLSRANG
jgi:pyroglutamyl-peptidase